MTGTRPAAGPIQWSSYREAVGLVARGVTFRTGSRIAVVVGTLLTAINQGSVLVAGAETTMTWIRIGANYLIPFIVASIGYLSPLRVRPETPASPA